MQYENLSTNTKCFVSAGHQAKNWWYNTHQDKNGYYSKHAHRLEKDTDKLILGCHIVRTIIAKSQITMGYKYTYMFVYIYVNTYMHMCIYICRNKIILFITLFSNFEVDFNMMYMFSKYKYPHNQYNDKLFLKLALYFRKILNGL